VESSKGVRDAAHAAASWARARRAVWAGDAPLPPAPTAPRRPATASPPAPLKPEPRETVTAARTDAAPSPVVVQPPPPAAPPPPAVPAPVQPVVQVEPTTHPAARHEDERGASPLAAVLPFLPRMAAAAAILALLVVGGRYVAGMLATRESSLPAATSTKPAPAASSARKATGVLRVNSTPSGAQVLVDGKARGVTPLALDDVPTGAHAVEIVSSEGTIRRSVTIDADRPTDLTESIFSGWVAVHAPFDLSVTEGSRALRADDRGQILLPPGRHELRLVNRTLAYDQIHRVEVTPGEIARLDIPPPRSTLTVTASDPAEVFVDGARVGDTPLSDAPIDVGTREIVVKRASGGERRVTATVTMKPYTLNVDFSR